MKYGIVLEGGGVRGAFHIGVWKALREMNIELEAVAGTSIGAINGALIAQGDFETAIKMWRSIRAEDIVDLPPDIEGEKNIFNIKSITSLAKEFYANDGFDMSPLENILRGVIDEDKIRRSPIGLGISAFSLSQKKGMYLFKDEIPRGALIDYIMASASILTAKRIGGETFSDGGLYDNLPVNILISRGIRDIITVDVGGVGMKRGFDTAGRNIIEIRSKSPQTGIMDFDSAGITRSIDEGYLACLKAFAVTAGEVYSFRAEDYTSARRRCSTEIISGVEKAARIFNISPLEIYTFDGLCSMVVDRAVKLSSRAVSGVSASNMIEKLKKEGGDTLLVWLVNSIKNGNSLSAKLSVLGDYYDAASAILYFMPRAAAEQN